MSTEFKMMRVAIIMPLAEQRGGGELMFWHLMQQGRDLGVEWLAIFLEDGPMIAAVAGLGIKTATINAGRMRQPILFWKSVLQIFRLIRENRVDVVLSWMAKPHLYGSVAARMAGVPAIWYQLGLPNRESRLDKVATLLPAVGILVCSKAGAQAQASLNPRRPIEVVYPGVELERFDPVRLDSSRDSRKRLGLPEEGPIIGIVGRLQRWKGFHVLLEAMPEVLSQFPHAMCVMVGGVHALEPDYEQFLMSRIAALDLSNVVRMPGIQNNVQDWMQAFDVFVHASDREPFGIVIIEALALGKPVVAGDECGPREIIMDHVHGLLTPYADSAALSAAIIQYLSNPDFAELMGRNGQQRAQDFSTRRFAENIVAAIKIFTDSQSPASKIDALEPVNSSVQ